MVPARGIGEAALHREQTTLHRDGARRMAA